MCLAFCSPEEKPMVVLIGVDGGAPELVTELRSQGKLPNIDKLSRKGASGHLLSLGARRLMQNGGRRGFWSPIIWATIATGKVPEKHGIGDFLLPVKGTSFAWIGTKEGPPEAELRIPEIAGPPPHELKIRLRSYTPNGRQPVQILINNESLAIVEVETNWTNFVLKIPIKLFRPAQNTIQLFFSRQSKPSEQGPSQDERPLAGGLASLRILDGNKDVVVEFSPVYQRSDLGRGFHDPEGQVVEAQSSHWKAKPVWSLLGMAGHEIGVIGYWSTWPAYEVNGFLVSSHVGLRGKRQNTRERLTWPPELQTKISAIAPKDAEMEPMIRQLYSEECGSENDFSMFEKILWQDEFYSRIAQQQLSDMKDGLFSIYFESMDGAGHHFLPFRHGAALPLGCSESLRHVIDKIYTQIDTWIGMILRKLPDDAIVFLVADHGMVTGEGGGHHSPYGLFVASGPNIGDKTDVRASVLDIAPTILYALGEDVPLDMDGKVAVQLFQPQWLAQHPPHYADIDTTMTLEEAPSTEVSEEMLKRLRSLGYIQ